MPKDTSKNGPADVPTHVRPFFKPIITLATSTVINDKAESVLIPKVLCSNEELKSVAECMACEHHGSVPNNFVVVCLKPEDDGDNK